MASSTLIFSHILPGIMGFIGILLICSGIMDSKRDNTIIGVVLFFLAGLLPFIVLPFLL